MASPARAAAAASVSGAFGLPPDARCSYDQPRRREVPAGPHSALLPSRRHLSISNFFLPSAPDAGGVGAAPGTHGLLQDERLVRTFVAAYGQPPPPQQHQQQDGGFYYPKDAVMAAVEECMRKQADALLHSLDGIGGRLSQLELYCYKLERSIGELRSDVMDYHGESTANFRCIDKNIRQVRALLLPASASWIGSIPLCTTS